MKSVEAIRIPRWIGSTGKTKIELHGFASGTASAYAAAVYFKVIMENGTTNCGLLTSRAHVNPIHAQNIERTSQCGATLLADLMDQIQRAYHGREFTLNY